MELPLVPVVIFLGSVTLLALLILVLYHYKLASFNQVTYEQRKDTYTFYNWSPFRHYSTLRNCFSRIWVKKPKNAIFRPLSLYNPEEEEFKIPDKKTPPIMAFDDMSGSEFND